MDIVKTVTTSDLRKNLVGCLDIKDNEAVQVLHNNKPVKIIITQEHYFKLLKSFRNDVVNASL